MWLWGRRQLEQAKQELQSLRQQLQTATAKGSSASADLQSQARALEGARAEIATLKVPPYSSVACMVLLEGPVGMKSSRPLAQVFGQVKALVERERLFSCRHLMQEQAAAAASEKQRAAAEISELKAQLASRPVAGNHFVC